MKKILIIEDDVNIRDTIDSILTLSSFDVYTASDGKSGVEMVMSKKPNLIICDVNMPIMSGFGVLSKLKKELSENDMPIFLFLTASNNQESIDKGMSLGADDYISKPFKVSELLKSINKNFEKI